MKVYRFVFSRFKPKPVPRWEDGSTEGIWEPVERALYEIRRRVRVVEHEGEEGIWVYSKKKERRVFIPLRKVDWSKIPLKRITQGLLTAVILTAVFSPRFRALLKGAVFKPELSVGQRLLGRRALWFITKNPEAVEKAFLAARTPGFEIKNFGFFKWKAREGFLVEGRISGIRDSSLIYVFGPKGRTLQLVDAYVSDKIPDANRKLFKTLFRSILNSNPKRVWINTGQGEGARMWAELGTTWASKEARDTHKKLLEKVVKESNVVFEEKAEEYLLKVVRTSKSPREILNKFVDRLGYHGKVLFGKVSWEGVLNLRTSRELLENLVHAL